MKNKRQIIGNTLLAIGIVLLIGAGVLFVFNMAESNRQASDSLEITTRLKSMIVPDGSTETSDSAGESTKTSAPEVQKTVEIDGALYDGILSIPAIELEMAVYDTWNDNYLRKSICRYYGSTYTNDLVIAGHNYRSGFGKLKKLNAGDEVFFTGVDGTVTSYVVKQVEVLDGTDISGMLSGGWDLSLYTCTYGGEARLTVRCEARQ